MKFPRVRPLFVKSGRKEELNPLISGLLGAINFAFRMIPTGESITIDENEQMRVKNSISINGSLRIEGQLVVD